MAKQGLCELHCHLDGSIRPSTFLELYNELPPTARDAAAGRTFDTEADIRRDLAFQDGWTLQRCLESFATTLLVMQNAGSLERIAFECCEDLHLKSAVSHVEVRYCPSLHRAAGLDDDAIVTAVAAGLRKAAAAYPGFTCHQILTALRDMGPDEALVMTKLAAKHAPDRLVVGVDLAGNEHAHPPELFVEAFDFAYRQGLGITIHAGEGSTQQASDNVICAIERLHATRIGHGLPAGSDPAVIALVRERGVAIEICPHSNVHTGSIASVDKHPVLRMLHEGLTVVPCCDNTLLSQVVTMDEYHALRDEAGVSEEQLVAVREAAHRAAFPAVGAVRR